MGKNKYDYQIKILYSTSKSFIGICKTSLSDKKMKNIEMIIDV